MIDKRYYEKLGGFAYLLGELRKKLGREQTDVLVNDAVTLCKGTDFELPFLLAVWLGLRTSEIRGLTWDCLDGDILTIKQAMVDGEDGPQLKQPKTYSGNRKLKVPPYIMGLLDETPHTDEYIVHATRNVLYKHLQRACARCGVQPFRFHDLRHTHATILLANSIDAVAVASRMGHADASTTLRVYAHALRRRDVDAANVTQQLLNLATAGNDDTPAPDA